MIVDSSALVAIIVQEAGHEELLDALLAAGDAAVGAPTVVETGMVLSARLGERGRSLLGRLLAEVRMTVVALDETHVALALSAFDRFGKGRHPAALNFGDCLTYAVAQHARRPLLCVGNDFAQTDLVLVLT